MTKFDFTLFLKELENASYDAVLKGLRRAEKDAAKGGKMPAVTAAPRQAPILRLRGQPRPSTSGSPSSDGAKKKSTASPRAHGEKRTPEALVELCGKVVAEIKKHPDGIAVEKLGPLLGVATRELALPIRKLLAEKKVKSKGQKRATRYFPTAKA